MTLITLNKKKIFYTDSGKGKTIVLLHGFMESSEIWNEYIKSLCKSFRVITVDLPGHGRSNMFSDIHTMDMAADLIMELLQALKINEFVFVAHSMGGYISMAFAEKYPKQIKGICMLHSSAMADSDEVKEARNRTVEIVKQNRKDFISSFIPDLFAPQNVEKYPNEISKLKDIARSMNANAIVAAIEGMKERKDRQFVLSQAKYPILFIGGRFDKRIDLEKLQYQAALPKYSEVMILEDSGRMGYIEAKEVVLNRIINFASSCLR